MLARLLNGAFETVQVGEMKYGEIRYEHCIFVGNKRIDLGVDRRIILKPNLNRWGGDGLRLTGLC
jgi:hypothetical protein